MYTKRFTQCFLLLALTLQIGLFLSDINGVGCIKLLSDLYSLIKIYYFFKNDNVMGGWGENGS